MTSTHGAPTLQAHIIVSVKRGITGMDLYVRRKHSKYTVAQKTILIQVYLHLLNKQFVKKHRITFSGIWIRGSPKR